MWIWGPHQETYMTKEHVESQSLGWGGVDLRQSPGSSMKRVQLSYLHRMEQKELLVIENDDLSKKIHEISKRQGLRNTDGI